MLYKIKAIDIRIKIHAVIHMSSGDKMEPFQAPEMALVCHVKRKKASPVQLVLQL